jgi:hypothetical protein
MRLLDTYALATGSKIKKPFIFENFFPLVIERYITFQAQTKFDSKDYNYWQSVINILLPTLEKNNIKIVQIGGANENLYKYALDLRSRTDIHQLAYVIKNAMLHLGPDSLGTHIASSYDIPIVSLYSVNQSSVSGPHFGSKEKQIVFDAYLRSQTGKPSYSAQENPKCINLIKPEEIANAVFKLLNIDFKTPFETVYIGEKFGNKIFRELIPFNTIQFDNPQIPIEIRMDIEFNEQVLAEQLSRTKGIVITNKRINKSIFQQLKANVSAIVYEITENDEPKFIEDIKDLGIPILLISSLPAEKIQEKKINYYQLSKINEIVPEKEELINNLKKDIDKLYFQSNKMVFAVDKVYMGNASRIAKEEIINDFNYNKVIDSPDFWKELQFCQIAKKID